MTFEPSVTEVFFVITVGTPNEGQLISLEIRSNKGNLGIPLPFDVATPNKRFLYIIACDFGSNKEKFPNLESPNFEYPL